MAEPQSTGFFAQLGGGLALILGWFWTMIWGSRKEIKEVRDKLDSHEKRVLKDYPTYDQMHKALDRTVSPIHRKLDDTIELIKETNRKIDKDHDNEMNRLRDELAKYRREQ